MKSVTKPGLYKSVTDFTKGKWSQASRSFIYATSHSAICTKLADEIEKLASKCSNAGFAFEVWDAEEISRRLKTEPELVDDFFGRNWVERFLGAEVASGLGSRLDVLAVSQLRSRLADFYSAAFGVADSGLLAMRIQTSAPVQLRDRFVTPDLIATTPETAVVPVVEVTDERPLDARDLLAQSESYRHRSLHDAEWNTPPTQRSRSTGRADEKWRADVWLGQGQRQVVVGEPGAGKSTLLRFLVLDLLSDSPIWTSVAQRWGRRLPIWLPFHFFTQRVVNQTGEPASLAAALKAWLDQHDIGEIWPLVEAALKDDRLLLVVDGLDEWVDGDAGRSAAAALETYVSSRSVAVVVSTRPYGLSKLTLGAGWSYARIAQLSTESQRRLARSYFISAAAAASPQSEAVERSLDDFFGEISRAADLKAISGVPLFLTLLIGLRLSSTEKLPDRRFNVYDRAIELLIADHPAKRRAAASVTATRDRLSDRQMRAVLAEVAYVSQVRSDVSAIERTTIRRDLIRSLQDPDTLGLGVESATSRADEMLDIAEGELGVLVRKGVDQLGFLHRMLQEQLAAEHAVDRLSPNDQTALVRARVRDPSWREVLLGIVWKLRRPQEVKGVVEAIEAQVDDPRGGLGAKELLAEIAFGPYGLPAIEARRHAALAVEAVETHPYTPHCDRLISSVVAGLDSLSVGDIAEVALARWTLLTTRPGPDPV